MSLGVACNRPAPVRCSLESNASAGSSSSPGSGIGSRWFLLTIAVLACSACTSVPKEVLDTVERAHQNFDAGNLEAALNDYQAVQKDAKEYALESRGQIEIRIGECQLRLGRPDEAR